MKFTKILALIVSAVFSASSVAVTVSQCKKDAENIVKQAQAKKAEATGIQATGAGAVGQGQAGNNAIQENSTALANTSRASRDLNVQALGQVEELLQQCSQKCDPGSAQDENKSKTNADEAQQITQAKDSCEQGVTPIRDELAASAGQAQDAANQAQNTADAADAGAPPPSSGGGGMSPMMAGLLGAAAGGLLGYMMGKKKGEKDKEKDKDKVVDENGVVDCSKSGAEAYSDCNDHFVAQCASDPSSSSCQTFSGRYCTGSSSSSTTQTTAPSVIDPSTGGVVIASAEDKDIKGEGVGSQFCFTSQATSFCAAASNRASCPSCLQLQTNKAEACKANPSLCLAQNSTADIEAAKTSCPSDPLFSNPNYANGGGSTVPTDMQSTEVPIIPTASNSGTSVADTDANPGAPDPIIGTTASVKGTASGMVVSSVGSGSNISGAVASAQSHSSLGGNSRDVASGSYAANSGAYKGSLKVSPQMGPSLFALSSEMISSRCKQGKFVHCDK